MGFGIVFLLVVLAVIMAYPSWHNWGAKPHELKLTLPGDEWHSSDWVYSTRAVTINAPNACIWPWICQIGQGRGGFYSFTLLENLLGRQTENTNWIHPEWQQLETGEIIPLNKKGGLVIWDQQPQQYLLLAATPETRKGAPIATSPKTTWLFYLAPTDDPQKTRLIVRSGTICRLPKHFRILSARFMNLATLIMEIKMMYSIRKYAETNACVPNPMATTN